MVQHRDLIRACLESDTLSIQSVDLLERRITHSPSELLARVSLIAFYRGKLAFSGRRHKHIMWVVEQHPEAAIGYWLRINKSLYPGDFEQVHTLYKKAIEGGSELILWNAFQFVREDDPEKALEHITSALLKGGNHSLWQRQLGEFAEHPDAASVDAVERSRFAAEAYARAASAAATSEELAYTLTRLARVSLRYDARKARDVSLEAIAYIQTRKHTFIDVDYFLHRLTIVIGLSFLREGDERSACEFLGRSLDFHHSKMLHLRGPDRSLANALSVANKYTVISFIERCMALFPRHTQSLSDWRQTILKAV